MITLPILSQAKFYSIVITIVILALTVGGTIWYISHLEEKIATLEANNKLLDGAIKIQQTTIKNMEKDIALTRLAQESVRKGVQTNNNDLAKLREKFEKNAKGEPRDFGAVAVKNPSLVTQSVNRGVQHANRCLEIASGAPLTEKEKNAKLKTEINTVCPGLANPSYKPDSN